MTEPSTSSSPPPRAAVFRRGPVLVGLLVAVLAALAGLWWLLGGSGRPPAQTPAPTPSEVLDVPEGTAESPPPEPEPELRLAPAAWSDLPGWETDRHGEALPALRATCGVLERRPAERPLEPFGGTVGDWLAPCAAARALDATDHAAARRFFETWFVPWAVSDGGEPEGLFTGYYEPTLRGSRSPDEVHRVPLHRRPPELVEVDLGAFRDDLAGRRLAGRLEDGRLVPYPDRRAIAGGALAGRELELLWVDDPVDAFFLHIQGSGRVELDDGTVERVGWDGWNGHVYVAIGRELVERGALELEEVSMQSIRAWLEAHPEEAVEVLAANPSYVFFRPLAGGAPVGSLGVELTPGRSLAVDRRFLPLGVPLWLDATAPAADPERPDRPLRRLLVAQDTGGAIRGPVRGDVFWGPGDEAAAVAGRMKHAGRLWTLLPRGVEPDPDA